MKTLIPLLCLLLASCTQIGQYRDEFGTPYYDYSPLHTIARICTENHLEYKITMKPDEYSIRCFDNPK